MIKWCPMKTFIYVHNTKDIADRRQKNINGHTYTQYTIYLLKGTSHLCLVKNSR